LFILKAICNDEKLVQDFVLSLQAKQQKLLGIIFKKSNEDIFHRIKVDFTMEQLEKLKREKQREGHKRNIYLGLGTKSKFNFTL